MTAAHVRLLGERSPQREGGQATVMIIGFEIVLAMVVVVVVDASAAYLRRQTLSSLEDGAALAAADGIEGEQVYRDGLEERGAVDPDTARALVGTYLLAVHAEQRYPGLRWGCGYFGGPCGRAGGGSGGAVSSTTGVSETSHVTAESASVVAIGN